MFKNHSIKIKFVKDAPEETVVTDTKNPFINDETAAIAKDIIKHVAVAGIAITAATVALKTIGQIAVVATESALEKKNDNN